MEYFTLVVILLALFLFASWLRNAILILLELLVAIAYELKYLNKHPTDAYEFRKEMREKIKREL